MFTTREEDSVKGVGEVALIQNIKSWLESVSKSSPEGIGDDCAVIEPPKESSILVTTDGMFLDRHFESTTPPELAGAKLVKRNISDIAAMGGAPRHALLVLMLPADLKTEWLRAFIKGIERVCQEFKISVNGGDITEVPSPLFGAHMTLMGQTTCPAPLLRTGGTEGDSIMVTGSLGGSLQGKHLTFEPRVREGQWLAQQPEVKSMIDITDGITKDLLDLLPENTDALLYTNKIPLSEYTETLEQGLSDGEDYELLFTLADNTDLELFRKRWEAEFKIPLTQIGRIIKNEVEGQSRQLIDATTGRPLNLKFGYQHLR